MKKAIEFTIFAAMYLLVVSIFAVIYLNIYDEFYFPNIRVENSYKNLIGGIAESFQKDIETNLELNSNYAQFIDPCLGNIRKIEIDSLSPEDNGIKFDILVKTENGYCVSSDAFNDHHGTYNWKIYDIFISEDVLDDSKTGHFIWSKLGNLELRPGGSGILREATDKNFYLLNHLPNQKPDNNQENSEKTHHLMSRDYFIRKIFPPAGKGIRALNPSFIPLSKSTRAQMFQAVEASQGKPVLDENSFWRMAYFSATTITTLGFGDMVPMTNNARIFVMIESMMGPIMLAAFFAYAAGGKVLAPNDPKRKTIIEVEQEELDES